MKTAVVIIPTYNERQNIEIVVQALLDVFSHVKTWKMHILVVDDTSPDKTYEVVRQLSRKHPQVHLLLNQQKAGLGGAYLKGMDQAFNEMNADLVFEFDADLSHDPKRIPEFLKAVDKGADLVLGSRYIKGGSIPADWGVHRKFLSVVGNIVIMLVLTDLRIRDWTTGYRAITKQVYDAVHHELRSERFSGYTFQIGFLHKAVRHGFTIVEVPFHFVDRTYGQSKLGTEYIKNTLLYITKVRLQEIINHRVFKFAFVGGIGALVQFITLTFFRQFISDSTLFFRLGVGALAFNFTGYLLSFILSIESAVVSNFFWNNLWTFADVKLKTREIPSKFLAFNIASLGSLLIQFIIAVGGQELIGLFPLFTVPWIKFVVDTGFVFAIVGIVVGMFWNFFAYNRFIWKK